MVEKDITSLFNEYHVAPTKQVKEYGGKKSTFISFQDVDLTMPPVELHLFEDELISVTFLNNYFSEMKDDDFRKVVKAILEGKYSIKKSLFGRKPYVAIQKEGGREYILPEQVLGTKDMVNKYQGLPKAFDRKAQFIIEHSDDAD